MNKKKKQNHLTMESLQENYDSVRDRNQRDHGRIENENVYEQRYKDQEHSGARE